MLANIKHNSKKISALTLSVFLVFYFERPPKYKEIEEEIHWKNADFDAITPTEIIDYVTWDCNYACSFPQGKNLIG